VAAHGLQDRVTCTGWQSDADFDRTVAAFDIALSLRWPHVGESSATLAALLAQGVPVVTEPVGSWAEFPHDVVARADLTRGAVEGLVRAVRPLARDRLLRRTWGDRARAYAREELSTARCAERFATACADVAGRSATPLEQARAAAERVAGAVPGPRHALDDRLRQLPPAIPGQRLLVVDAPAGVREQLPAWGYAVTEVPLQRTPTGSVDAVAVWGTEVGASVLAEVQRVLVPGGLLHSSATDTSAFGLTRVSEGVARKTGPVLAPRPLLGL
jgi:hypothetical protein